MTGICESFLYIEFSFLYIEFHVRFLILLVSTVCFHFRKLCRLNGCCSPRYKSRMKESPNSFSIAVCSIISSSSIYKINFSVYWDRVLKSVALRVSLDSQTFGYGMTYCKHLKRVSLPTKNMNLKAMLYYLFFFSTDHWEIFTESLDSYGNKSEPPAFIKKSAAVTSGST